GKEQTLGLDQPVILKTHNLLSLEEKLTGTPLQVDFQCQWVACESVWCSMCSAQDT
ncbi:Hypothetical predicted protein, partial [Marmota monax]